MRKVIYGITIMDIYIGCFVDIHIVEGEGPSMKFSHVKLIREDFEFFFGLNLFEFFLDFKTKYYGHNLITNPDGLYSVSEDRIL